MDYYSLGGGLTLIAAAAFIAWRRSRGADDSSGASLNPSATSPTSSRAVPAAAHPRPHAQMPIHSAEDLLQITGSTGLVEVVRNRLALTSKNWAEDAWPVIERYAEFVQLLPASESHHHAQPGGLLTHTLEVASYALTIRQGQKLPAGATPEEQVQLGAVWSFAVLLGALLHDIGKPVSDVRVLLFGDDPHTALGSWPALAGPMNRVPGATHYEVDFPTPEQRSYSAHQRLAVVLLHAIVPPPTMRWLSQDPRLLPALIAYLDDQPHPDAEAIASIIKSADSTSVADNLKSGPRTRFARARQAPLIERLQCGLRTLAAEGALPINRPGAALFVDPDGVHLWAVAGVIADKVRALINEREIRQEGAAGIPTDNTRLFDTWSEYGALVQPDKDHGKGSVWWVRVEIDEWVQVLTVLKFRLAEVYVPAKPGAQQPIVPKALQGKITPVSPNTQRGEGGVATGVNNGTDAEATQGSTQHRERAIGDGPLTGDGATNHEALDAAAAPTHSSAATAATSAASLAPSFVDPDDFMAQMLAGYDDAGPAPVRMPAHGSAVPADDFLDETDTAASIKPVVKPPVQALTIPTTPPKPKHRAPGAKPRPDADSFFSWVQQGLGTGDLSYNDAESAIHFTNEGMALVSPKIFKLYLEEHSYQSELSPGQKPLNALQNDLQRGGYTSKNGAGNFFTYQVRQSDGTLGATLTTYIVPNPQAYIRPVPSPNPVLVLRPAKEKLSTPSKPARGSNVNDAEGTASADEPRQEP